MTRLYHGRVVDLSLEQVRLPNGELLELEIMHHPGGAAVVAEDAAGAVCLLRQYRHAAGDWLWELPAGKREGDEPPLETARRELREEAGLEAGDWLPLGQILTTPGFCDEEIHLFLARGLSARDIEREPQECIAEVRWVPLAEALQWLADGRIRDAKTLAGLFLAARLRGNG